MNNSALFTHLDKMHLHVTTQVFRVERVVDTTGAGKGLKRLVVMAVIIVLFAL